MSVTYKPDIQSRAHPVHSAVRPVDPEIDKDAGTDEHIEHAGAVISGGEIQVSVLVAMPCSLSLQSAARKLDEHWQMRECAIGSCNAPVGSHAPRI